MNQSKYNYAHGDITHIQSSPGVIGWQTSENAKVNGKWRLQVNHQMNTITQQNTK